MKIFIFCLFWISLLSGGKVQAFEAITCYPVEVNRVVGTEGVVKKTETWCYQQLKEPKWNTFVFNFDDGKIKPELAFIVDAKGVMTHGSLKADVVDVHRINAREFNPFPAPYLEPKTMHTVSIKNIEAVQKEAIQVIQLLRKKAPNTITNLRGRSEGSSSIIPWRGFWWPYKNSPLSGDEDSPMAKYDRFVEAKTGQSPGAAKWENSRHAYRGVWWEGHCNGWAASSVLRKEPKFKRQDDQSGVEFSVSDQKGLLAEADYCGHIAFFGGRSDRRGGRDYISPLAFHKTILYYLGELRKPIAINYKSDSSVDNHVISAYSMNIQEGEDSQRISITLTVHRYDGQAYNSPGPAPEYIRRYQYILSRNSSGTLGEGRWLSEYPSFLWVPLSIAACSENNQNLENKWVDKILSLPQ